MKIGIDARMYGPKQTGIGLYIKQIIQTLEQIDTHNEYVIFLRRENWNEYQPQSPNFKKVLADVHWYGWKEQIILPFILRKQKVDLMHFPHWNVPLFYRRPFVMTIHDLLLLIYPTRRASKLNFLFYKIKSLSHRLVIKSAATRARAIATVSAYSAGDIETILHIPKNKIIVTHIAPHIADENIDSVNPTADKMAVANYKITRPYVLYIGTALPHKNLARLVQAWDLLPAEIKNKYQLALAGKIEYFYQTLKNDRAVQTAGDNIIFTNFVADADVPALYKQATAFVYPSLYEGFGMPPLEAMFYHTPVCAANVTSIPEVSKDGALYFNPQDPADIARAIEQIITDDKLRQDLVKRGTAVVNSYSWDSTAQKTLEIYEQTLKNI